jgi:NADH-quinone oxidoreductase subunit H
MGLTSDEFTVQFIATLIKFAIIAGLCINIPPIMVWAERRIPAFMQRRKGPNRTGLFKWRLYGLLQSAADAVKLIFKEEVVPEGAQKAFYHIAPIFSVFPAILIAMAIPYGPDIQAFGQTIPLSIIRVDVGFLFIFAVSSLAVYGVTIAGWASNNKYSLLGAIRASAQMVSYEIPLGMSLIPIVLVYGSLDLNQIALAQTSIWNWGVVLSPISFVLFLIAMFAETNRAPFDMAEAEGELVAGFHTEYTSAKFAAFFLAEYVSMFVLSCLAATVFFGGWQIPFFDIRKIDTMLGFPGVSALVGFHVLVVKAAFFMWLFVWVRWTLPRFRYDQLMSLGWRYMIPIGLLNVVLTAIIVAAVRF